MNKTIRETPYGVAAQMIEMSGLTDNMSVLEPSAGSGRILTTLTEQFTFNNLAISAVELNSELHQKLTALFSPRVNVYHGNFLQFSEFGKFDRIIAAPPFKKNADVLHIQKMYSLLKTGGVAVSLTSPFWMSV
jgi:16S rRNA A1518/A1519 N6-dimethyltransferase RsmA/KsgA/DIM1 with predicted DNA glycosylase/AP lyase activity